mmetsp:Transcript_65912/g.176632  ORF Transcript_65912/g.176632 Transcript_65912/m.176632 type:complete len:87 (+) Transcript_65912:1344-1604(+)
MAPACSGVKNAKQRSARTYAQWWGLCRSSSSVRSRPHALRAATAAVSPTSRLALGWAQLRLPAARLAPLASASTSRPRVQRTQLRG